MAIRITVQSNRLPAVAAKLPAAANIVLERHGREMEATAKRLVPVDTGALRDSIAWEMTGETSGQLVAGQEYAGYVEFGTRHAAAQPYIRPAFEQQRPEIEAAFRRIQELIG